MPWFRFILEVEAQDIDDAIDMIDQLALEAASNIDPLATYGTLVEVK